ncbi:MAG: hypothetical protein AB8G26_06985 [Ilumatobacter sp.]
MIDDESGQVLERFRDLTLPKPEWTHEAHLRVCAASLAGAPAASVLRALRTGIRRYNEATGVDNTPTGGYHETLTRYYVGAVSDLMASPAAPIATILTADRCSTTAPLRYWNRDTLFSPTARLAWVAPDLEPFAWPDVA